MVNRGNGAGASAGSVIRSTKARKLLLGSTALIGMGLIANPAAAQSINPSGGGTVSTTGGSIAGGGVNEGVLVQQSGSGGVTVTGVTITNTGSTPTVDGLRVVGAGGQGVGLNIATTSTITSQTGDGVRLQGGSGENVGFGVAAGQTLNVTGINGLYITSTGGLFLPNPGGAGSIVATARTSGAGAGVLIATGGGFGGSLGNVTATNFATGIDLSGNGVGSTIEGGNIVATTTGIRVNSTANVILDTKAAITAPTGINVTHATGASITTSGTGTLNSNAAGTGTGINVATTGTGLISVNVGAAIGGTTAFSRGVSVAATNPATAYTEVRTTAAITVSTASATNYGVFVSAYSAGNRGTIDIGASITAGSAVYTQGGAYDYFVRAGATVTAAATNGVGFNSGNSTTTFNNAGTVQATGTGGNALDFVGIGTIVNQAGGIISGANRGMSVSNSPTSVNNAGMISGGTSAGYYGSGTSSFTNTGTITGNWGLYIPYNVLGLSNTGGTITGVIDGVNIQGPYTTITNTGTINTTAGAGSAAGIYLNTTYAFLPNTITNSGTITGGTDATFGYGVSNDSSTNLTLTNQSLGTIGGGAGAIRLSGTGVQTLNLNLGSSTGRIFVDDSGSVTATVAGSLTGDYVGNTGTGIVAFTLASTGSMQGATFGSANDTFTFKGGTIAGVVNGGGGTDTFNSALGAGNSASLSLSNLTGFEAYNHQSGILTLTGTGTRGWSLTGGTLNLGVDGATTASIITTGNSLVPSAGTTLNVRTGSLIRSTGGVTIDNVLTALGAFTIDNAGTIDGTSGNTIQNGNTTLTLNNSGTVSTTNFVAVLAGANSQITNSGTITGGSDSGYGTGIEINGAGTVTNQNGGVITGVGHAGVQFDSGIGTLNNNAGATITGASGIRTEGNAGLSLTNAGMIAGLASGVNAAGTGTTKISNSGTIGTGTVTGGAFTVGGAGFGIQLIGGQITNSGTISSSGAAINQTGTSGTLNLVNTGTLGVPTYTIDPADTVVAQGVANILNSGSISNPNFYGVAMASGGTLTNAAVGTITGGTAGDRYAVYVINGPATINNYGTLTSTTDNQGIVSGNSATTINLFAGSITGSILTGAGNDTLALYNGQVNGTAVTQAYSDAVSGAAGSVTLQNSGTLAAAAVGAINLGGGTDTLQLRGTGTGAQAGSFAISTSTGAEILTKADAGTWTLTGAAITPAITINAGQGGTPGSGGLLIFNGTTGLTGAISVNGAIIRAATAGAFGSGTITTIDPTIQYGATGTYSNNIVLASADTAGDPTRIQADSGVTATLTGVISQSTAGQPLVFDGAGSVVLTNANTYTGVTTVNTGTLTLNNINAISSSQSVTLGSSGTLIANTGLSRAAINNLSGAAGTSLQLTGGLSVGQTTDTVFGGVISGNTTTGIDKDGTGKLTLTGANTLVTGFGINAGTLALSGSGSISTATGLYINAPGATFDISGISAASTSLAQLIGQAGTTVTLGSKTLITGTSNTSTTHAGSITGTGGLTKAGSGTFTLSGANTYTGATSITGGVLQLGNGGAASTSLTSGVTIANGTTLAFKQNASSTFSAAITGPGSITVAGLVSGGASNGNELTLSGALTQIGNNAGTGLGTGGLFIVDASRVTLSGGYTGAAVQISGAGARLTNLKTVNTTGTAIGPQDGIHSNGFGGTVINGALDEATTSVITAGASGIINYGGSGVLAVTNYGRIHGVQYDGVTQHGAGALTVSNQANAVIYGQNASGSFAGYGVASDNGGMLTLTNAAGGRIVGHLGVYATTAAMITNSGLIGSGSLTGATYATYATGTGEGISVNAGGTITNNVGGLISGSIGISSGTALTLINYGTVTGSSTTAAGVNASGTGNTVTNYGTIEGGAQAIVLNSGGTVYNYGSGSILRATNTANLSNASGIYSNGALALTNQGTISTTNTSTSAAGVEVLGTLTASNTGSITAVTGSGISFTGTGSVINSGTITGGSSAAFGYGVAGGGTITNQANGVISGGAGGLNLTVAGTSTVTNTGTISGTNGTSNGINAGVGTLVLTNNAAGIIAGRTNGVVANNAGASITNSGTIGTGTVTGGVFTAAGIGNAMSLAGGSVTNSGTIVSAGSIGVSSSAGATVINSGTIKGGTAAVSVSGGNATITNTGRLESTGTVVGSNAVNLSGNYLWTVTNEASGTIVTSSGDVAGILTSGGSGVLTNRGTITSPYAIYLLAGAGAYDIINSGTITSTDLSIYSAATGAHTVANSGTINGGGEGIVLAGARAGVATITNSGSITGGTNGVRVANGAASITNSGTLSGTTAAIALSGNFNDTITLNIGSVITGGINMGDGNDTLNFNGGTLSGLVDGGAGIDSFTSNIGNGNSASLSLTNLTNFETYLSQSGNLTLTGSRSGGAGWTLTGGSLTLDGSLTNTGVDGNGVQTHGIVVNGANTIVNIASGAALSASAQNAIQINFVDNTTINNNGGTIGGSTGFAGIRLNRSAVINNNAGSLITSTNPSAMGISNSGAGVVVNNAANATISGNYAGIDNVIGVESAAPGLTVNNSGAVTSFGTGYAIRSTDGTIDIVNLSGGTINGGAAGAILTAGAGAATFDLQAGSTVTGNIVSTGSGARTIVLRGTINGNYDASGGTGVDTFSMYAGSSLAGGNLGAGDDFFNYYGGAITGIVDGGDGYDSLLGDFGNGTNTTVTLSNFTNFENFNFVSGDVTVTGPSASPDAEIRAQNGGTVSFTDTESNTGDIYIDGGNIRANTAGAFGTGTIHFIDPTAFYGATGTYANDLSLEVQTPASTNPSTLSADAGVVATLTGQIYQGMGMGVDPAQPLKIDGAGTIVLTNTANNWAGTTTITGGSTLQGASNTISGSDIVTNGTLAFVQPLSGTFGLNISGFGGTTVSGLNAGEALTFSGTSTAETGFTITDASTLVNTGSITSTLGGGVDLTGGGTFDNEGTVNGRVQNTGAVGATLINAGTVNGPVVNAGSGLFTINNMAGGAIVASSSAVISNANSPILLSNAGDISGSMRGIQSSNASDVINNSGRIVAGTITGPSYAATGANGIALYSGGTVNNLAGGLIAGVGGVASYAGTLTLNNQLGGTITGGDYAVDVFGAANITNAGTINAIQDAAIAMRAGGSVTNSGTISGGSSSGGNQGLSLDGGAAYTIVNQAGGVINNGIFNFGTGALNVDIQAGSTINGGIFDFSDATGASLIIAGTLNGAFGGSVSSDLVTLVSGGFVTGVLNGNGGTDSFVLAGAGNGSVNIGNILNFENRTMNGTGVWTLTGFDGSTAGWTINSGTLAASGGIAINDFASVTVAAPGTLQLLNNEAIAGLNGAGNVALGANTLTLTGGTSNYAGVIGGTGGVTIANNAAVTLSGANTYTGQTSVNGATLTLGASNVLADASALLLSSGTINLQGFNDTVASADLRGTLNGTGTLTAANTYLNGGTVNANLGAGTLVNQGGTSTLNGTSAAGTVGVSAGILVLGASDRLADNAAVTIFTGGTLNIGAFNDTVGNISIAGTLAGTGTITGSVVGGNGATYTLNGGTVNANLGTGILRVVQNASVLNGTAAAAAVNITSGTLALGASDRLADSAAITVESGASLNMGAFNDTVGTAALNGTLAGTGTLTAASYTLNGAMVNANLGAGSLTNAGGVSTLNGTSAAGTVGVNAGTLALGASDRLADTAALTVASGATLNMGAFNDTVGTAALNGTLAGTGTLTAASYTLNGATVNANLGAGALSNAGGVSTLNGILGAGVVSVNAGTLSLGAADRLSDNAGVTLASGATLNMGAFNDTVGTASLSGTLAGTGTLTAGSYMLTGGTVNANLGTGTLTNSGNSTLNGTAAATVVAVNAGTLTLGASDRLADNAAVTVSGATLNLGAYNDTVGTATLNGTLAGTGTLTAASYTLNGASVNGNLGTGTLIQASGVSTLSGTSAASLVNVQGGALVLGANERIANNAALAINTGAAFGLAGFTETVGTLTNGSAGAGTLSLGAGRLVLAGNGDSGFSGAITGSGSIDKQGSGRLTLAGDFATTGRFDASAGTLAFLGTSQGGARVQGGTLIGQGTFAGNLTIASGVFSPGGLVGANNIVQPLGSFQAQSLNVTGGSLLFDFGGSNLNFASDSIRVSGPATLAGGTVAVNALSASNQYSFNNQYLIVQAGTLTGTFANGMTFADVASDPALKWRLRYDLVPNSVVLQVQKQIDFAAAVAGGSSNQLAIGQALNGSAGLASDQWAATLNTIAALSPSQRGTAYDSMSGEAIADASTSTITANVLFLDLLRNRIGDGNDKLSGTGFARSALGDVRVASTQSYDVASRLAAQGGEGGSGNGVWGQAFGGLQKLSGLRGQAGLETTTAGVAMGADGRVGDLILGVAGGYTEVTGDVDARNSTINGRLAQIGGYASYDNGSAFMSLAGNYYWGKFGTQRLINLGGAFSSASGQFRNQGYSVGVTAGYRADLGNGLRAVAIASATQTHDSRDAFTERANGGLGLTSAATDRNVFTATGEIRLGQWIKTGSGSAMPYVSVGMRYNAGDLDTLGNMRFSGAPTGLGAFQVQGARMSPLLATWGAGIDVKASENVSLGIAIENAYADRTREGRASMRIKIGF